MRATYFFFCFYDTCIVGSTSMPLSGWLPEEERIYSDDLRRYNVLDNS